MTSSCHINPFVPSGGEAEAEVRPSISLGTDGGMK